MENIPLLIRRIQVFRQACQSQVGNQRGWEKNGNAALEGAQHRQQTFRSFDRTDKWKIKNDLLVKDWITAVHAAQNHKL